MQRQPRVALLLADSARDRVKSELREAGLDVVEVEQLSADPDLAAPDFVMTCPHPAGSQMAQALERLHSRFPSLPTLTLPEGRLHHQACRAFNRLTRWADCTVPGIQESTSAEYKNRLRLMAESVRDHALFLLDAHGRISSWGPGAQLMKGYTAEEAIGRPLSVLYPAESEKASVPDRNLQTAMSRGSCSDQGWRARKDGSRFWASASLTALRDHKGDLRGFAKITRDMTAQKKAEHEYQRLLDAERAARTEAEHHNRRQDEFMAMVSHLCREPLQAITDWTELLGRGGAEASHATEIMRPHVASLNQIVESLLASDATRREPIPPYRPSRTEPFAWSTDLLPDRKVLCVDDDPDNCELLTLTLIGAGSAVHCVSSTKDVMRMLTEIQPHLLVIDLGLPETEGYRLIRQVRGGPPSISRLPCLALTTLVRPGERERLLSSGFDECLMKPYDPGLLVCLAVTLCRKADHPQ